MRSRWLVGGFIAAWVTAAFTIACGSDTFTAAADDAATTDAASDAGGSDAATSPFCEGHETALLCADFDESDIRNAFTAGGSQEIFFSYTFVDDAGAALFRDTHAESPPYALRSQVPPTDGSGVATAFTGGFLSSQSGITHFRLEAGIRFNAIGSLTGSGNVVLLELVLGNSTYVLQIASTHLEVAGLIGKVPWDGLDLGNVPSASSMFVPIVIDVTLGNGGRLFASVGSTTATTYGASVSNDTTPTIVLGCQANGGSTGSVDVSFDDVVLTGDDVDAGFFDAGSDGAPPDAGDGG